MPDPKMSRRDALSTVMAKIGPTEGVYLVGGSVRDFLAERTPTDLDIVVTEDADRYAAELSHRLGTKAVRIGKPGKMIHRLIAGPFCIDIAPMRGGAIETDLALRDFSVNAMALSLASGRLIDPLNGRRDLETGVISMVGEQALTADPVRLLRAFRFSAQLRFSIHPATLNAISVQRRAIKKAPGERVWDELRKMLSCNPIDEPLRQMSKTGLFFELFPEIASFDVPPGAPGDREPHRAKTMAGLRRLESMLAGEPGPFSQRIRRWRRVAPNRRPLLKLALLLGDAAEGRADEEGNVSCDTETAGRMAGRLRLSKQEKSDLAAFVHGRRVARQLFGHHCCETVSARRLARFFRTHGDVLLELVLLCVADSEPAEAGIPIACIEFWETVLKRFQTVHLPRANRPPLLSGIDLIEIWGLQPGPLFRRLLETTEDAKRAGEIRTREEAIAMVGGILREADAPPPHGRRSGKP